MKVQYVTSRFPTVGEPPDLKKEPPTKAATEAGVIGTSIYNEIRYHNTLLPATPRIVWTVSPDLVVVAFVTLNEVAR